MSFAIEDFNKKLVIWGTGNICRRIRKIFSQVRPEFFLDNDLGKSGTCIENIPVYHPSQVDIKNAPCIVLAMDNHSSTKGYLLSLGLKEGHDFFWYRDWLFSHDIKENLFEAETFMKSIEEEASWYIGKKLLFSDFLAFDKGACSFAERWNESVGNIALLSEVGWISEDSAKDFIQLPVKRLPWILSHHQYDKKIYNSEFDCRCAKEYAKTKEYLLEGAESFRLAYPDMADGYEYIVCTYADQLVRKIIEYGHPSAIVLWNAFYAFHRIVESICKELDVPIQYMEFGNISGNISVERIGQMGESWPARSYEKFLQIPVYEQELLTAENEIKLLREKRVNRNVQPRNSLQNLLEGKIRKDCPVVLYLGSNDYASGLQPYTDRARAYHSPIFGSSDSAAIYLADLCKKHQWNLIYKPHPMMMQWFDASIFPSNTICLDEVDIHDVIDLSDVVITILSTTSYVALIRKKPVVMLGYTQLKGKGCTYEAFQKQEIEHKISEALSGTIKQSMQENFIRHVVQMEKYYTNEALRMGTS